MADARTRGQERRHSAAAAGPRQLLAAAQAAWARGDRRAALRDLSSLSSRAGDGDEELAMLAARLERRLQYEGTAGG